VLAAELAGTVAKADLHLLLEATTRCRLTLRNIVDTSGPSRGAGGYADAGGIRWNVSIGAKEFLGIAEAAGVSVPVTRGSSAM